MAFFFLYQTTYCLKELCSNNVHLGSRTGNQAFSLLGMPAHLQVSNDAAVLAGTAVLLLVEVVKLAGSSQALSEGHLGLAQHHGTVVLAGHALPNKHRVHREKQSSHSGVTRVSDT